MTPLRASDPFFGHRLFLAVAGGGTVLSTYAWATTQDRPDGVSCIFPILSFALLVGSRNARRRLAAHEGWNREWNRMAGGKPASEPKKGLTTPGKRKARMALLIGSWALLGLWLDTPEAHVSPNFGLAASGFGFLTLWTFGAAAFGVIRWASGPSRVGPLGTKADRGFVVSQCLPVPRSSPSAGRTMAVLPGHIRALLGPSPQRMIGASI